MTWYLVHTKPRQEHCALINLENQGYRCYLPLWRIEKCKQGTLVVTEEPLFPRYLFVRYGQNEAKGLAPIRSTKGISRLVTFGNQPANVTQSLIDALHTQEMIRSGQVQPLFRQGEQVTINHHAYKDIDAIYSAQNGVDRVIVLIEMLSRRVPIQVPAAAVRKLS